MSEYCHNCFDNNVKHHDFIKQIQEIVIGMPYIEHETSDVMKLRILLGLSDKDFNNIEVEDERNNNQDIGRSKIRI